MTEALLNVLDWTWPVLVAFGGAWLATLVTMALADDLEGL